MDVVWIGNLIEAGLWGSVALVLAVLAVRTGGERRGIFLLLSVAFLMFGVSDLIEMRTGAWWRPVWLLAIKAACIVTFAYGFLRLARSKGG